MSAFAVRRISSSSGGTMAIRRGGFTGPVRRPVSRPVSSPAPRAVTSSRPISVMPKTPFTTYYDPSRVIDLDRLKVVKDMRGGPEFGEGRGDTQSGDKGVMSPNESGGGGRGMPAATAAPATPAKNNLIPLALLVAGALLIGG